MCNKIKKEEGKENSLSHGGRWKRTGIKQRDLFHDCIQQRGIIEKWLQPVPIDLKALAYGLTFDFNCPIRINVNNNKSSHRLPDGSASTIFIIFILFYVFFIFFIFFVFLIYLFFDLKKTIMQQFLTNSKL